MVLTTEALGKKSYGILTQIDVSGGVEGEAGCRLPCVPHARTCNPGLAYETLKLEDKLGTVLPCNAVVHDADCGRTEVAAMDSFASMQAIDNPGLKHSAEIARGELQKVMDNL